MDRMRRKISAIEELRELVRQLPLVNRIVEYVSDIRRVKRAYRYMKRRGYPEPVCRDIAWYVVESSKWIREKGK